MKEQSLKHMYSMENNWNKKRPRKK